MLERLCVSIKGAVQGVGFRPFVYRLAKELGLRGFVINDSRGVYIEVEGERRVLEEFLIKLNREKPTLARIHSVDFSFLQPAGYSDFEIKESSDTGQKEVFVLPDMSTCEDCLKELFDPSDRRYLYPFINCTNCGPRFTIIDSLPYDRPNTTMKFFKMCYECEREYHEPSNRRFHAQPNACPECGPWLSLYSSEGKLIAERDEALTLTLKLLRDGKIVAVKGVGGFHLMCDATREEVVSLLRDRKRRKEKPFAVMFRDLSQLKKYAEPSELELLLLTLPERPIVLTKYKGGLAPSVAPGLKRLGAFLPYSPLHHILLRGLDFPLVATSGNFSEEPIVIDNEEALKGLSKLSDFILLHNRDIKRRCDDSVVKVIGGVPTPIRRSRGYAPMPVGLPFSLKRKVLAVGGMLKNTFALAFGGRVIISQHVGDVENLETLKAFEEMVFDLMRLYEFEPEVVVCDMHPRYETTRWAEGFSVEKALPLVRVQHHFAHILSCMAENQLRDKVLGIAWDGTGYGEDGTLWGGEFLECDYSSYMRLFHFRPFRLIGGERAVKEPRRVALSILFELFHEEALDLDLHTLRCFEEKELKNLYIAWKRGINSPYTSSVGRLFDAVASLLNIRHTLSYEGQASMMLEDLYDYSVKDTYPFELKDGIIDWKLMFLALIEEREPVRAVSRFINTLAHICLRVAQEVSLERVCLSGGVMQNDPLVSKIKELLESAGFRVYTHQKVPPNDGGLSLGQAVFGGLAEGL
ncbi:carbamoyltransferase HypF [Pampinifervens florentissimum]|uniref:carbamoyltransferase HypF n=1 Tax=Pampinifervens florentissimum TaxID=1632019 RepID=UPI0013B47C44|nr:carbamoyltransferase HypF [Hydrogenobacter sp. T-8]QID33163.1 carbamoyltransferase HypF [Hydrogenobacter sp. T-8]